MGGWMQRINTSIENAGRGGRYEEPDKLISYRYTFYMDSSKRQSVFLIL